MSKKVVMEYEYMVVAGKGGSSAQSMANEAHKKAAEFFGDLPFTVHAEVSGKPSSYYVKCSAVSDVEVEG